MSVVQEITDDDTYLPFNIQSQSSPSREKPATRAGSSVRLDLIEGSHTTITDDILGGWRNSGTDVRITASGNSKMELGTDLNNKVKTREAPMNLPGFSLFNGPRKQEFSNTNAAQQLIVRKSQYQGRRSPQTQESTFRYKPYITITGNSTVFTLLHQIAKHFQFIDRVFADFFQNALPHLPIYNPKTVSDFLEAARRKAEAQQSVDSIEAEEIFLGDLGHFCEDVFKSFSAPENTPQPIFTTSYNRDNDLLRYLQDGFEVFYWDFMVDRVLDLHANSHSMVADVLVRYVDSVTVDLQFYTRQLEAEKLDSAEPLLGDIKKRMDILRSIRTSTTVGLGGKAEWLENCHCGTSQIKQLEIQKETIDVLLKEKHEHHEATETSIIFVTLSFLFLAIATVPGIQGFSIALKSGPSTFGSTEDSDFWTQISSSTITILGNLFAVAPLFKHKRSYLAHGMIWLFFVLGLLASITSVAIYPFCNTAYSAIANYIGGIFSIASIVITTQTVNMKASSEVGNRRKDKWE